MTQSNSKLTSCEKMALRDMKIDFSEVKLANNERTTIAFKQTLNTVEFSLAVSSKTEKKFRRKVGEYLAFMRYLENKTVKMDKEDFYDMLENMGMTLTN